MGGCTPMPRKLRPASRRMALAKEKAAEIYMKTAHLPRLNTITDEQMHQLEKRFGIQAREGYLD